MDSIWTLEISNWKDFGKSKIASTKAKQMHFNFSKLNFHEIALKRP